MKCWGWNDKGQLGLGDTQNRGDGAGAVAGARGGDDPGLNYFSPPLKLSTPPGSRAGTPQPAAGE